VGDGVWEEMKQAKQAQTQYTLGNAWTQIVPISDFRVSLVISAVGSDDVFLSLSQNAPLGTGIGLVSSVVLIKLTLVHDGRLVRGPIYACCPSGSVTVTVWEALHPCPCLR
jgi:hypothetical protein